MPIIKQMQQLFLTNAAAWTRYDERTQQYIVPDVDWIDHRVRPPLVYNPHKSLLISYTPGQHIKLGQASYVFKTPRGRYFSWSPDSSAETIYPMTEKQALEDYTKAAKNPVGINRAFPGLNVEQA